MDVSRSATLCSMTRHFKSRGRTNVDIPIAAAQDLSIRNIDDFSWCPLEGSTPATHGFFVATAAMGFVKQSLAVRGFLRWLVGFAKVHLVGVFLSERSLFFLPGEAFFTLTGKLLSASGEKIAAPALGRIRVGKRNEHPQSTERALVMPSGGAEGAPFQSFLKGSVFLGRLRSFLALCAEGYL